MVVRRMVMSIALLFLLLGLVSGLHETTQRRKNSDYDVLLSTFSSGPSGNLSLSLHVDIDPSSNPNVDPNFLWFTLVVLNNDQRVRRLLFSPLALFLLD